LSHLSVRSCQVFFQSSGFCADQAEDVANDLRVAAVGRDRAEARFYHLPRVGLEEGRRVHAAEEHAAVKPVPVVHDPPHAVGVLVRLLRQPRRHEPDEVRLDLEVDVVRVGVVTGMARVGRLHAAVQQAARGRVRVPETVLRIAEHRAVLLGRGVEADAVHDFGERHLDVEVVLVDRVVDPLGLPGDGAVIDLPQPAELRRGAEGDADHLSRPPPADLVFEHGAGEPSGRRCGHRPRRGGDRLGLGREPGPGIRETDRHEERQEMTHTSPLSGQCRSRVTSSWAHAGAPARFR
jgi:hypothetical protein